MTTMRFELAASPGNYDLEQYHSQTQFPEPVLKSVYEIIFNRLPRTSESCSHYYFTNCVSQWRQRPCGVIWRSSRPDIMDSGEPIARRSPNQRTAHIAA